MDWSTVIISWTETVEPKSVAQYVDEYFLPDRTLEMASGHLQALGKEREALKERVQAATERGND